MQRHGKRESRANGSAARGPRDANVPPRAPSPNRGPQASSNPAPPRAGFPGGQARLPRLDEQPTGRGPIIDMVDTAFVGGGTATIGADATEPNGPSGFTDYFTYESLFEEPGAAAAVPPDESYGVLRVAPTDTWDAMVAQHRALVKEFHPDRFVGQPMDVIAQAEREMKRINAAYAELRKRHGPSSDRRSGVDRRKRPR